MRDQKRKQVAATTSAPAYTNEPEYKAIVARCKAICASISGKQWELGDEADTATQKWGETSLEQLAADINFDGAPCTLGRCRDVCRAWPKNRARARFFSSAKILATHPGRFEIVERNPDISKREAREEMRKLRAEHPDADQPDEDQVEEANPIEEEEDTAPTPGATTSTPAKGATTKGAKKTADEEQAKLQEDKRWLNKVIVPLANEMIGAAEVRKRCTSADRRDLLAAIEPALLETVEKAGEAWVELVDWLNEGLEEAAETEIQEGRVRTAPKPASAPVQPRA